MNIFSRGGVDGTVLFIRVVSRGSVYVSEQLEWQNVNKSGLTAKCKSWACECLFLTCNVQIICGTMLSDSIILLHVKTLPHTIFHIQELCKFLKNVHIHFCKTSIWKTAICFTVAAPISSIISQARQSNSNGDTFKKVIVLQGVRRHLFFIGKECVLTF